MKDTLQSKAIDLLRFPLVLFVLFVHTHAIDFPDCVSPDKWGEASIAQILFSLFARSLDTLGMAAVPAFFFISGFLFFVKGNPGERTFYIGKWKKRLHSLLIPFVMWNVLAVLAVANIPALGLEGSEVPWRNSAALPLVGFLWNSTTMCVGFHNWWGLGIQLYYPEVVSLWFVRDLIVMVALAPLVYLFVRGCRIWGILALVVLHFFELPNLNGLGCEAVMFFTLGAYFALNKLNLYTFSIKYGRYSLLLTVVLLAVILAFQAPVGHQPLMPFFYLAAVGALLYLSSWCVCRWQVSVHPLWVQTCFFIYALHLVLFGHTNLISLSAEWSRGCVLWLLPQGVFASLLIVLGTIALTVGVSIVIYVILKKICPALLRLFSGGR